MNSYRFNYIITIHNKEELIEQVINSIIKCCGSNSYIYPVLDGCSDNSERIIDKLMEISNIPIIKIYAENVHELLSINKGLGEASQNGKGFNILLQDDVVLNDFEIESKVVKIYEHLGYESIGVLAFRHGVNVTLLEDTKELENIDIIESWYGHGIVDSILPPGHIVKRMVGVRSPECISFFAINKIGFMDEKLAPYTYDNHDFSIRCLQNGLENYVFSINYISDLKWGGMRTNPHSEAQKIMLRNRKYLYEKHKFFLESFDFDSYSPKKLKPFTIPHIEIPQYGNISLRIATLKFRKKLKFTFQLFKIVFFKIKNINK